MKSAKLDTNLLIRLPNWVGDTIMALPAIEMLQQRHPGRITLLGRSWIHALLAAQGLELVEWPRVFHQAVKILKSQEASRVVLMTNSFSSALIARLSCKKTLGFSRDARGLLLSHRVQAPEYLHEMQQFAHLARAALQLWGGDCDPLENLSYPQLKLAPDAMIQAQALLALNQVPKRFIVLCPFAQGLTKQKQTKIWPYWQALSKQLQAYHPIICPGPNELELARELFPHIQCIEQVDLFCLPALFARAELVIANDSGPMHIAAAVNCRTYALFGATDPRRSAPANAQILGELGVWPSLADVLQVLN